MPPRIFGLEPVVKVVVCCRWGLRTRHRELEAVGVEQGGEWGGGIPLPIRLGGLGSVVSSPIGVRGGAPAENEFGAFYLSYRTLLVEGKTIYLSITILAQIKKYESVEIHKSSIIIWDFNTVMSVLNWLVRKKYHIMELSSIGPVIC